MNKKFMLSALAIADLCVSGAAMADDNNHPYRPEVVASNPADSFRVGAAVGLGTPYGGSIGVNFRLPYLPWFKIAGSGTFNLAPGIMGSLLVDPIKFPIAPVANFDAGWQSQITIPTSGRPTIEWTYENIMGGLAFGGRDSARFLLLAGMTHIDGSAWNIQASLPTISGLSLANPKFNGWLPAAKLGLELLF